MYQSLQPSYCNCIHMFYQVAIYVIKAIKMLMQYEETLFSIISIVF